jgi:homoserine O-acetyltransferase
MVRANQLFLNEYPSFAAALSGGPTRWMVVSAPTDRVFLAEGVREFVETLRGAGKQVETAELAGPLGHLNGVVGMAPVGDRIRAFLGR